MIFELADELWLDAVCDFIERKRRATHSLAGARSCKLMEPVNIGGGIRCEPLSIAEMPVRHLRAMEDTPEGSERPRLSVEGYDLTDGERDALVNGDIAAIYAAGTHPVIVNGYCRAMGYKRADYRPLLESVNALTEGKTRWQTS